MYSAGFYPFPDQESKWGYWSHQALLAGADLDVTPLLRRLPLGDAAQWADGLLERRPHLDARQALVRAGFDIRASAQRLSDLYEQLDREAREEAGR